MQQFRDSIELDETIIGGGIIGVMTAYELKKKFPQCEVALIEAAPFRRDSFVEAFSLSKLRA